MKNTHQCPKCGSAEIIRLNLASSSYKANLIPVGRTIFNHAKIVRYVCGRCGFSEEWIDSPTDLQKVVAKWGTTPKT
jgi:ribosomal protein S27AE